MLGKIVLVIYVLIQTGISILTEYVIQKNRLYKNIGKKTRVLRIVIYTLLALIPVLGAFLPKSEFKFFCMGFGNGIGVLDQGNIVPLENIPMNNSVSDMTTDYEGNLWFVSTRQGVMKIVPNQFTDIFAKYGLQKAVVNSTCMLDGILYFSLYERRSGSGGRFFLRTSNVYTDDPLHFLCQYHGGHGVFVCHGMDAEDRSHEKSL